MDNNNINKLGTNIKEENYESDSKEIKKERKHLF